jgi:anaerobic selenocysteine-containing dehydrogenase
MPKSAMAEEDGISRHWTGVGAAGSLVPTSQQNFAGADVASQPVEIKRTYCRICIVHCGLLAEVAGDRILKVRGDKEHPLIKGYTCPKGRVTGQVHHLEGAITRPMMRKDGELVEVDWDEALDDTADVDRLGGMALYSGVTAAAHGIADCPGRGRSAELVPAMRAV